MTAFDVAIGIDQDTLNRCASQLYSAMYPKLFTGSAQATEYGIDVTWDVQSAPQFSLAASAERAELHAQRLLQRALSADVHPEAAKHLESYAQLAADAQPTFSVSLPNVVITLQASGQPPANVPASFTLDCYVAISGTSVSFVPSQVSAQSSDKDPIAQAILAKTVAPLVQQALTTALSGIVIPSIDLGVPLSPPSAVIDGGKVVVLANLASKGTPPPTPAGSPWPSDGLFLLLSADATQAATAYGVGKLNSNMSDGGSGGSSFAGYHWSYSMRLDNPRAALSGTDLQIDFSLTGSVDAGVTAAWIPIGVGFDASASPDPTGIAGLSVQGGNLVVTVKQVSPFVVTATPSGSVPSQVLGWMLAGIVNGITLSLSPAISSFIQGVTYSMPIPSVPVDVDGVSLVARPTGLAVANFQGLLALVGGLEIDKA